MEGGGVVVSNARTTHHRGSFHGMLDTYGKHGTDNLSLWLTNAKEAASKITEATRMRQKEKKEKYSKFLRDLQTRVAVSAKERRLSKIPPARPCRLDRNLWRSGPEGSTTFEVGSSFCTEDLSKQVRRERIIGVNMKLTQFLHILNPCYDYHLVSQSECWPLPRHIAVNPMQQVPGMDNIRAYLEKQLRNNPKNGHGVSNLHRECVMQAFMKEKATEPPREKPCSTNSLIGDSKSDVPKEIYFEEPNTFARPVDLSGLPTNTSEELRISGPCTPTGWNMIPISFSALEMRNPESASSPRSFGIRETVSQVGESADTTNIGSHPLCYQEALDPLTEQAHSSWRSESCTTKLDGGCTKMRGGGNGLFDTLTTGSKGLKAEWAFKGNVQGYRKGPLAKTSWSPSKWGQTESCKDRRVTSMDEHSVSNSSLSSGVTTCSMGVVVLKGREEYEARGQGRQFFSDVWRCAMEVERRCAHEHAHSLHTLKKKRMEQQKEVKRHRSEMLKEKSLAKQREAVQLQLKSVATLRARRDGIVQRHKAVEKKRFAKALRAIRLERMDRYGVQVPPLCNCGHGVHPLNSNYIKKCFTECPLRDNFLEYTNV